jgi:Flp pilus assembly protein TadG
MTADAPAPPGRKAATQSGVAAIDFALVLPVLLLLFFGMISITQYISMKRKVQSAAELVADLVTRQQTTIASTLIDDYFKAVELSFRPMNQTLVQNTVGIDLYGYRSVNGAASVQWSKFYRGAKQCTPPTVKLTDPIGVLLADTDVVVAVVCVNFKMPVAKYTGIKFLATEKIEKQFALRPRQSTTLTCVPSNCP